MSDPTFADNTTEELCETLTRAVLVCIAKQAAKVAIERHRAGA